MQPISKPSNSPTEPRKRFKSGIYRRCNHCNTLFADQHKATDHIDGLCDICNYKFSKSSNSL